MSDLWNDPSYSVGEAVADLVKKVTDQILAVIRDRAACREVKLAGSTAHCILRTQRGLVVVRPAEAVAEAQALSAPQPVLIAKHVNMQQL